ncbi:MAG: hypothetical protein ACE5KE_00950 [Methanosarcinales archaeon]
MDSYGTPRGQRIIVRKSNPYAYSMMVGNDGRWGSNWILFWVYVNNDHRSATASDQMVLGEWIYLLDFCVFCIWKSNLSIWICLGTS